MRRSLVTLLLGSALRATTGAPAPAEHIAPHRHFVVNPDGELIEVGPDACAIGPSRQFDEFHFNVHRGVPAEFGFDQDGNPVGFVNLACPEPAD